MNPKTVRFDNMDSAVIIISVSKAVQLLINTAESMLLKHPVLRIAMS